MMSINLLKSAGPLHNPESHVFTPIFTPRSHKSRFGLVNKPNGYLVETFSEIKFGKVKDMTQTINDGVHIFVYMFVDQNKI